MIEVLEKWFYEVWTNENADYIREVYQPDRKGSSTGLGTEEGLNQEEYVQFHAVMLSLFQNIVITVDSHIAQGDQLAAQCTITANDRETGKKNIKGAVFGRIKEGKVLHADNHFDFLGLFEGLGALPEGTFAKCIAGEKLC